eukprot:1154940-Pelagomonas_calceolata.AAC.3
MQLPSGGTGARGTSRPRDCRPLDKSGGNDADAAGLGERDRMISRCAAALLRSQVTKLALKLHAHSFQSNSKLASTALENTSFTSHRQDQASGIASKPPECPFFSISLGGEDTRHRLLTWQGLDQMETLSRANGDRGHGNLTPDQKPSGA